MSLEEKVLLTIEKYSMLDNVNNVYVGLSGGADSVSLLLAMNALRERLGCSLSAVHVNHHIRGAESDRDEKFCSELCARLDIPIRVFHVYAKDYAEKEHLSLEEAARKLRYDCFDFISDGARLCTAHNLNDNAETVLFNLVRGTGLKGLCGIPPVRGSFIRPLIACTRDEIEEYLHGLGQDYVTDSTNLIDDCSRNITRHKIVPLMEDIHGGFLQSLRRMTENLSQDCAFIEDFARENKDADLRTLHPSVRKRIILNLLSENDIPVSADCAERISDVALNGNGRVNVAENVFVNARDGRIHIEKISPASKQGTVFEPVAVKLGKNDFLCDKTVMISENANENISMERIVNEKFTKDRLDCDKIQGVVIMRNRRCGDEIKLCSRSFTSSLKTLMNAAYPQEERDFIPILADDAGIIWVEGLGIADRVKITESTSVIWCIEVVKDDNNE